LPLSELLDLSVRIRARIRRIRGKSDTKKLAQFRPTDVVQTPKGVGVVMSLHRRNLKVILDDNTVILCSPSCAKKLKHEDPPPVPAANSVCSSA